MPEKGWRVYIADAFAKTLYGGNQAGVVILEEGQDFPPGLRMRKIAGELKHSETAFVKRLSGDAFQIRYFTPAKEVDLCGHATIGAFSVLQKEGMIQPGVFRLETRASKLSIEVKPEGIWMDMASPQEMGVLSWEEAAEIYDAFGLNPEEAAPKAEQKEAKAALSQGNPEKTEVVPELQTKIVSTGLADILLPVADKDLLQKARLQAGRVSALSEKYQVVGVHMFSLSEDPGITAECRNFAPLYEIPEESATGTSNGALTFYLFRAGLLASGQENVFLQGEAMGKPSYIRSRLEFSPENQPLVRIGGSAVISMKGVLLYEE